MVAKGHFFFSGLGVLASGFRVSGVLYCFPGLKLLGFAIRLRFQQVHLGSRFRV